MKIEREYDSFLTLLSELIYVVVTVSVQAQEFNFPFTDREIARFTDIGRHIE